MEKQGGKRRQEEEEDGHACFLDVDAEADRCPKKARKELEVNSTAEHEDVISQVPDLAQDKIFGLLGVKDKLQAAQVCSSWWNAVYRPCQWKEVKVRLDLNKVSQEDLSSFQQRRIRHLEVDNFRVQSNLVEMLHEFLVSLDLSRQPLPMSVLQKVFYKSFKSLRKLGVHVENEKPVMFQRVEEVFQHLSNLEHLDLFVDSIDDVVPAVGRQLKNLKHFSLTASHQTACNLQFLGHLSSLQSLSLHKVHLSGMEYLKSSCKTLKKVSFSRSHFGTDGWAEVLSQLSSLEELELSWCTQNTCTEDELRQLIQAHRNLKVLVFILLGTPLFFLDFQSFPQMTNLETLRVCYGILEHEDDLRALSSRFKSLRSLGMMICSDLSVACMKCIAGLSSLQELSLKSTPVHGPALEMISGGSCQLRKLELICCWEIRDEDMKHVAGMSSLQDLTLAYMTVGSDGMNHLKQGTLRLETLTILECQCTFQDVKPLLEEQQSLHQLRLGPCRLTVAERIEAQHLRDVFPFLKEVHIFERGHDTRFKFGMFSLAFICS